jgi:hypothetical protein
MKLPAAVDGRRHRCSVDVNTACLILLRALCHREMDPIATKKRDRLHQGHLIYVTFNQPVPVSLVFILMLSSRLCQILTNGVLPAQC